ncbi:NAD(+) synthase [uncultured Polaribacter sp.]|uniref:NAD(+) synthase n=1 Tax=uncultured Polaribacter sp. TaxID=174711 RepID=UPI0026306F74|nr:NAD(+) synthase [uncultured Polaribacter sp.]
MKTEKVAEHIIEWLKEYANNAHIKGFVVGVSGGIDSAVTASLCAKTGLSTLCVEMPIHQAENQVKRGRELIDALKNKYKNVNATSVDLTATFESFKTTVPTSDNTSKVNLSLANTRARLRMTSLYYLAGLHGYLVVGTGNKVEDFGVGFYTKYGDGGVDLSPIADLMKSEVYQLASFLEVPESIQKAVPTDGLFGDSRTDEDQLGASYDELEWAMKMQDSNKNEEDFIGRELEVFKIYSRLNTINQHKMVPIPICIIPNKIK